MHNALRHFLTSHQALLHIQESEHSSVSNTVTLWNLVYRKNLFLFGCREEWCCSTSVRYPPTNSGLSCIKQLMFELVLIPGTWFFYCSSVKGQKLSRLLNLIMHVTLRLLGWGQTHTLCKKVELFRFVCHCGVCFSVFNLKTVDFGYRCG